MFAARVAPESTRARFIALAPRAAAAAAGSSAREFADAFALDPAAGFHALDPAAGFARAEPPPPPPRALPAISASSARDEAASARATDPETFAGDDGALATADR